MDLHQRLAEIRAQQGREPLPDPSVIQGFEEGTPPPPEFVPRPPVDLSAVPEGPTEHIYDDPDFEPESPLIPRTTQTPVPEFQQNLPQASANLPKPDFSIIGVEGVGYAAEYMGRQVGLSEGEVAQAKALVLRAIQRSVQAQLNEVKALLPKRKRAKRKARLSDMWAKSDRQHQPSIALPPDDPFEGAGVLPGTVSAEVGVHDSPGPQPAPKKRRKRLDGGDR
jgi:hypothetical protein